MNKTNTIGIDLAKNTFHLCTQDSKGHILSKHKDWPQSVKTLSRNNGCQQDRIRILPHRALLV